MTKPKQTILAVMQDLMFMVRIQEAGKRAGFETTAVKTKADALRKADEHPALVVIDLNHEAAEPIDLIKELKGSKATCDLQLLAFVSHVQTDLRAAAVAAGCDTVLARSSFVQNLAAIIERLPM